MRPTEAAATDSRLVVGHSHLPPLGRAETDASNSKDRAASGTLPQAQVVLGHA